VLPITSAAEDYKMAGSAANARLQDLHWPPDLVWLGVGADGHTASIFSGPDLKEALEAPIGIRAIGVAPDPLPAEAPVNRVTLTASAIVEARTTLIVASGAAKKAVLDEALEEDGGSQYPIAKLLGKIKVPVDIYWLKD
jgi:6-phosphogluconolactonase